MKIERVDLFHIVLPIKKPFVVGCGTVYDRHFVVVRSLTSDGIEGWGEVACYSHPSYSYETTGTALHILSEFVVPSVLGQEIAEPADFDRLMQPFRGHYMAKCGLELTVWGILSKEQNTTVREMLGGRDIPTIGSGVSIGMTDTIEELHDDIAGFLEQGYQRIKIKIKPGWDVKVMASVREKFGDIQLMADANSSFSLEQIPLLKQLDAMNLMMIEQPLANDDIVDHAQVQAALDTPICLDESIESADDARKAIELGSCRIVNIKVSRVGGLYRAKQVHDECQKRGIPNWVGSMLHTGIFEGYNIAFSTLPNVTMPGDVAPSNRYFKDDIVMPFFKMSKSGTLDVPQVPGCGCDVDLDKLKKYTIGKETFRL